ncbi:hypothetical protein [Jiangella alba]|uniref:Uncharacterized protein n=1 Tax=Jiangella alba TaxID=561176 RepID=A0A1H5P5S2_9ACTN|nr:hypothetical protein [Jiangella alba]SEF08401.1 hypothetical protein SAMN04488561_3636 [Jiangella alba]
MKTLVWAVLAVAAFLAGVVLLAALLTQFGGVGQYELLLIMLVVGVAEFLVVRRLRRRPERVPE